jgi:D-amino-acid dehydrogenase
MVPIAEYSRDSLKALRSEIGITYDERAQGTLQLFRTQSQYDGTGGDIEVLKQFGVPYELLDPAGCIAAEPALTHVRGKFVGGLRLPGDETGDCQMFTTKLAALCAEAGVTFKFNTTVTSINTNSSRIVSVSTETEELTADAYVMAFGSYSPFLLRRVGVHIPVYPVKGYSITVPITDAAAAPVSTVMDESYKVAITRLGDRIRAGGTAEISGYDLTLREPRRGTLEHSVGDLFPKGGDLSKASFWTGLRPMTPDGPPIIGGGTKYSNLYLNTGHGTLGWTMACGSGRVLADLVSGKSPDVDASPLNISRYG